ncbi:MAG: hypothetical protein KDC30_17900, partial [Saprospiraceae bacterium]|nr:hypothetical protein [Saprospiraceae bacterium]
LLGMAAGQIQAQTGQFWSEADQDFLLQTQKSLRDVYPQQFRSLALDLPALRNYLKKAPMEFSAEAKKKPLLLDLPLPDGRWETFELVESPVLKPGLAAKYPSIKTYSARGLHDRSLTAHFDYTPKGFHAMIRTERGFAYIDPLALDQTEYYMAYYPADYDLESLDLPPMACGTTEIADDPIASEFDLPETPGQKSAETPVDLRVYDLAMSCTGEFAIAQGSTVELVLATMATIVNRNNEIFLSEAAFKFELIENNDLLVYLNPATDPFPNANLGFEILDLATAAITSIVPAVNFDVGHVLTLGCIDGIAGVASAGATCGQNKARGMTCFGTSNIDFIVVNVMAHELGHQFSALHSWSNCPNSPAGQLESGEAFEPGSGSTIMSYAGSCGDQNLQFSANDYFHVGSLDDIVPFTLQGNGNICPDIVPTENHYPEVSLLYENGFYIPISTPFELNAIGEDVDGDQLTYCWEQHDLGPTAPLGMPIGDGPSFRSLPPTTASNRYFPRLSFILNNDSGPHEVLPTYSRNLTFRCTVRDNSPEAGGVAWEEVKFKATAEAGPFLVTSPNTAGVVWKGGEQVEVSWDVANTDNSLVNCQQVDILLSTDGGNTWPYTLANATPNTGSAIVFVPDLSTSQARIRVQASQNVFFDLSNFNFQIEPADEAGYS